MIGCWSHHMAAWALTLVLAVSQGHAMSQDPQLAGAADANPSLLSFGELVALSSTGHPQGPLGVRLDRLLTVPFVRNFRTYDAKQETVERNRTDFAPCQFLRVVFWNIERGLSFEQIRAALSGPAEFERVAQMRSGMSDAQKRRIDAQLSELKDADVVVLNEVD